MILAESATAKSWRYVPYGVNLHQFITSQVKQYSNGLEIHILITIGNQDRTMHKQDSSPMTFSKNDVEIIARETLYRGFFHWIFIAFAIVYSMEK